MASSPAYDSPFWPLRECQQSNGSECLFNPYVIIRKSYGLALARAE